MQREKIREDEGKRSPHMWVRLPKALHSFGKAPVRELTPRVLSMVAASKKEGQKEHH
jgi:hypothetical protein